MGSFNRYILFYRNKDAKGRVEDILASSAAEAVELLKESLKEYDRPQDITLVHTIPSLEVSLAKCPECKQPMRVGDTILIGHNIEVVWTVAYIESHTQVTLADPKRKNYHYTSNFSGAWIHSGCADEGRRQQLLAIEKQQHDLGVQYDELWEKFDRIR